MDRATEQRATQRRRVRATERISNGVTERRSDGATKQRFRGDQTVSAKSKRVGTLCRDFLMPILSAFWPSIKGKARVVVSLGMRWMAWSSDDDETDL